MSSKRARKKDKRVNDRRLTEALASAREGRLEAALSTLDDLCRLAPHNARYSFERGRLLALCGRDTDAVRALRRALQLVPEHHEARAALVELGAEPPPLARPRRTPPSPATLAEDRELPLTAGVDWSALGRELLVRGVALAPSMAPADALDPGTLAALADELHARLLPLAIEWAERLRRPPTWPPSLAARRAAAQAFAPARIHAPRELVAPPPDDPAHLPVHAILAVEGRVTLERADLRPGRRRAASVDLDPGDVGLITAPRRPVVVGGVPALQPIEARLAGEGSAQLLF